MPKPISPVAPGLDRAEVVYGANQPQYVGLPVVREDDGLVVSRWHFSFKERVTILFGGSIWISILTFRKPLQPIKVETVCPVRYQSSLEAAD